MSFAFVFPGQGSQALKMMDGLAEFAAVQTTFAEAAEVLGVDLAAMLRADSPDEINRTVNTQPLMLTAGVATYRAWLEAGGAAPAWLAGHSLGEFSALVAAGALSFADALRLVRLRAQAMQDAVPEGVGAMAAIVGFEDLAALDDLCKKASTKDEIVAPANLNTPEQTVLAGHKAAVERAMAAAKAAGAKRALLLPMSVPSHSVLMQPAAERLAQALAEVNIQPPSIPVLHNADVAEHRDAAEIAAILVAQLVSPVRWTETIQALAARDVLLHVECAPCKTLAGMGKRIDKRVTTLSLTDGEALRAAMTQVA